MSLSKTKKFIYVHTESKVSGTTSNFVFDLNLKNNDEYDTCCVLGLSIPKSYYNIREGYNTFTLDEITSTATITIPPANYSRNTLKSTLQSVLNSSSPRGWTYAVSIPSATSGDDGKYTFTVSGNSGVQPQFIFTTKMTRQLGFDDNSTNTFSGSSLKSTNVIYLQSETVIYLHSNLCGDSDDGYGILQECYAVQDQTFSNITWQCPDVIAYSKKITNKTALINFYLTDEDDEPLDINGLDFHFTLLLYKEDDTYDMARNFMKYLLLQN